VEVFLCFHIVEGIKNVIMYFMLRKWKEKKKSPNMQLHNYVIMSYGKIVKLVMWFDLETTSKAMWCCLPTLASHG
jgi:hypothetical protein